MRLSSSAATSAAAGSTAYEQPSASQEHLATATTMYREMAMRFWLEKADAEQKA